MQTHRQKSGSRLVLSFADRLETVAFPIQEAFKFSAFSKNLQETLNIPFSEV
jgi:hypothetical protein